eukprot:7929235-Pyramimonas_sp.AAC.1
MPRRLVKSLWIVLIWDIVKVTANLSTGDDFSCAVLEDNCQGELCYGHVRCWGSSNKGQTNVRPAGAQNLNMARAIINLFQAMIAAV